jgi:hypothetical protein
MIIGFHQDEAQEGVADVACGHQQPVRHTPPWINRPWVGTCSASKNFILAVTAVRGVPWCHGNTDSITP